MNVPFVNELSIVLGSFVRNRRWAAEAARLLKYRITVVRRPSQVESLTFPTSLRFVLHAVPPERESHAIDDLVCSTILKTRL